MKAVETKYVAATNTKPTRIRVRCEGMSVTMNPPDGPSDIAVHRLAMEAAVRKWWGNDPLVVYNWTAGGTVDGRGLVWVASRI